MMSALAKVGTLVFVLHKFLQFVAADKPFGQFSTISAVCLPSRGYLSLHTVYCNLNKMLINLGSRTVT